MNFYFSHRGFIDKKMQVFLAAAKAYGFPCAAHVYCDDEPNMELIKKAHNAIVKLAGGEEDLKNFVVRSDNKAEGIALGSRKRQTIDGKRYSEWFVYIYFYKPVNPLTI